VTWVGEGWHERLAWGVLGGIALSLLAVSGVVVLYFKGVWADSLQLWRLISDPIWGLAGVFSAVALFSPSLFRGVERLMFLVILSMVVIRILLYAHIANFNQGDATITESGNRVLLYIWPLLLYWVSCSGELRGLFAFVDRMPRASPQQRHS